MRTPYLVQRVERLVESAYGTPLEQIRKVASGPWTTKRIDSVRVDTRTAAKIVRVYDHYFDASERTAFESLTVSEMVALVGVLEQEYPDPETYRRSRAPEKVGALQETKRSFLDDLRFVLKDPGVER